jgi:hypothetical protein
MLTDRFRSVAIALQPYISDTYDLLNATDAVLRLDANVRDAQNHDSLVAAARGSEDVLAPMREGRKILAIKALRSLTGCGLKAAKEAVEDSRVMEFWETDRWTVPQGDPWALDSQDSEPPF